MITCSLGEKKYTVDYITGRALREMEPAAKMYAKIVAVANAAAKGETVPEEQQFTIPEAMDVMIRWFCLLFGDQFTVDEVLDHYPVDRLMHDVALALMAVQTQTTSILNDFPTTPAATQAEKNPAWRCRNSSIPPTTRCSRAAGAWMRSTAWTCPASSAFGRGRPTTKGSAQRPGPATSTRSGPI